MKFAPLGFAARLFLGAVFIYAGFSKLISPVEEFRAILATYQLIPYPLISVLAVLAPWMELVFGTFIVLGYLTRPSALMLSLFSLSFVLLLGWEYLANGHFPKDCGCFGSGFIRPTVPQIFLLDILNTLLGICLFLSKNHPWSLDHWLSGPEHEGLA
jgi:uncharacterized membrane protein YphA (DoxX/SURF4 family)